MTFPTDQEELNVCRHLGLSDDQESHATYATEAHRCFKLDTPTKIASQHQERFCLGAEHPNCPIFKGEGLARGGARPAAPTAAASSPFDRPPRPRTGRDAEPAAPRAPRTAQRPTAEKPFKVGGGGLSPRPRAGGISMRTMTIGLFVLAAVILGLAFWIQSVVGGDSTKTLTAAQTQATQAALKPTTATTAVRTTTAAATQPTPGNSATATAQAANRTPTVAAGTATTGTGAKSYTVKSGDNCGSIADASNITLEQLLSVNGLTQDSCRSLQVGQVLKLP